MQRLSGLRASLKRGALLTAANWPVILIQFAGETVFKILLAIPVIGGVFLVALLLGADVTELLRGDWRYLATSVTAALQSQPLALLAFGVAFLTVLLGGSALMFLIKGGVVSTLVTSEVVAGPLEHPPLRLAAFWRASQFGIESFIAGCSRLFQRYLRLGLGLLAVYAVSGAIYLTLIVMAYRLVGDGEPLIEWTMLAAAGSTILIVWITLVNLLYLLTQMVIAIDDRPIGSAMRQVITFLRHRPMEIAIVFGSILVLVVIATVGSMVAAAGLGLISFVPLVGLAVLPLQVAAWLVRGLVFQYLGLTALGAYVVLYRPLADRSSAPGAAPQDRGATPSPFVRSA